MRDALLIFFVTLALGMILTKMLIPVLHRMKMGQTTLENALSWHSQKSGTPTMGGLVFVPVLCFGLWGGITKEKVFILLCGLLFWLIGALDDGIKIAKKRNMGLTSAQKFSLQIIASLGLAFMLRYVLQVQNVWIPFLGDVNFGVFFIPFVMVFFLAVTNSVNLTDGLDGLATSTGFINAVFLSVVAFILQKNEATGQMMLALCGMLLAFFMFNHHPAKVFMGDTGSLCLGGLLAGAAAVMHMELALFVSAIWFVIETASVIIQTMSFRMTGKRFFKMSPFHHHLELCMWKETKIVFFACVVTALASAVMYLVLYHIF